MASCTCLYDNAGHHSDPNCGIHGSQPEHEERSWRCSDAERAMEDAQAALAAASDPKLGLNRLVSVREVVEALRSDECYDVVDDNEPTAWGVLTTAADFIESKFGEHGKAEEA